MNSPLRASTTNPLLQVGYLQTGDQAGSGNCETKIDFIVNRASVVMTHFAESRFSVLACLGAGWCKRWVNSFCVRLSSTVLFISRWHVSLHFSQFPQWPFPLMPYDRYWLLKSSALCRPSFSQTTFRILCC
jgi:hypothetical protein